ncbi:hypothetical protein LXL04_017837 [Taraxacum kok-saghyz]
MLTPTKRIVKDKCHSCSLGKHYRLSFNFSNFVTLSLVNIIHYSCRHLDLPNGLSIAIATYILNILHFSSVNIQHPPIYFSNVIPHIITLKSLDGYITRLSSQSSWLHVSKYLHINTSQISRNVTFHETISHISLYPSNAKFHMMFLLVKHHLYWSFTTLPCLTHIPPPPPTVSGPPLISLHAGNNYADQSLTSLSSANASATNVQPHPATPIA